MASQRHQARTDTDSGFTDIPEEAVMAAAQALFDRMLVATGDESTRARRWLESAEQYREYARAVLTAALPYLRH
jgi:hypothetical protein